MPSQAISSGYLAPWRSIAKLHRLFDYRIDILDNKHRIPNLDFGVGDRPGSAGRRSGSCLARRGSARRRPANG